MADRQEFRGRVDFKGTTNLDGTTVASTRIRANAGFVFPQGAPADGGDNTNVITAASILTQIVTVAASADRSKATDTAANLISGLSLTEDNDAFDFSLINTATDGTSAVTLTGGTGVTLVGGMQIQAIDTDEEQYSGGVAQFRVRRTSSTAVTIYRIG